MLFFNGASIASWLPTFSLELHHQENQNFNRNVRSLNGCGLYCQFLARQVAQIHTMFPHMSLHTISTDLTSTNSVSQTIDNILNGDVVDPIDQPRPLPRPLTPPPSYEEPPKEMSMERGGVSEIDQSEQSTLRRRITSPAKYQENDKSSELTIDTLYSLEREDSQDNGELSYEEKKKRMINEARRYRENRRGGRERERGGRERAGRGESL